VSLIDAGIDLVHHRETMIFGSEWETSRGVRSLGRAWVLGGLVLVLGSCTGSTGSRPSSPVHSKVTSSSAPSTPPPHVSEETVKSFLKAFTQARLHCCGAERFLSPRARGQYGSRRFLYVAIERPQTFFPVRLHTSDHVVWAAVLRYQVFLVDVESILYERLKIRPGSGPRGLEISSVHRC
jgi:hypothetical protein